MNWNLIRSGIAALLCLAAPAHAITVNDSFGAAAARALADPYDAVGEVRVGTGLCSGSLISATAVLTARHCIQNAFAGQVTVNFGDGDGVATTSRSVSAIRSLRGSALYDGGDVAVLTLSSAVTTIDPLRMVTEAVVGETVRMVGYGLNGLGSTGHRNTRDGARWAADNILDRIIQVRGNTLLGTDFDNPTETSNSLAGSGSSAAMLANEGSTSPGDSGGPLMVNRNGEWVIAGVLSGGSTSTSAYGDVSNWTGLSSFGAQFLTRIRGGEFIDGPSASARIAAVPLPAGSVLLVGAFGLVGLLRVRRTA